jgi:hypothetical protein
MQDIIETCLERIRKNRLPGLDFNPDFIFPLYNGFSVANLPASIGRWLGNPDDESPGLAKTITNPFSDHYDQVILLVVDSLGMPLFRRWLHRIEEQGDHSVWKPLWESITIAALTSTAPSTTSTVLTSLWTGKEPIQHGVVGYEMWLPELGVIANMISHAPADQPENFGSLAKLGFNPRKFLNLECMGTKLKQAGIGTDVFMHASIAGSGLSTMLMGDTNLHPWRTYDELWQSLHNQTLNPSNPAYTHVYLGDLDTLSHRHGPGHELVWQAWLEFSDQLAQFLITVKKSTNKKVLFLLSADHGQIPQAIRELFEIKKHPRFLENLSMLPSGESRMPYLFTKDGADQKLQTFCEETWPGKFKLVSRDIYMASGVLGTSAANSSVRGRLGDWIMIPTGNDYIRWGSKENRMLGRHGGFLAEEMIVPLLAFEV